MKLQIRCNPVNITSIHAFADITGRVDEAKKDVYFVRALGTYGTLVQDIQKIDQRLSERMSQGKIMYRRVSALPKLTNSEDINQYIIHYQNWKAASRKKMAAKAASGDSSVEEALGYACSNCLDFWRRGSQGCSASIESNFLVKLIYWFDQIAEGWAEVWKEKRAVKIIADNIEKKQEYLFYYLLTLMGVDVLLLQTRKDIEPEMDKLALSSSFVLGEYGGGNLPPFSLCLSSSALPKEEERVKLVLPQRRTEKKQKSSPLQVYIQPKAVQTRLPNREKTFEELAQLAASVVMVEVQDEKGRTMGNGSGIMLSRDGYILTNHHVASHGIHYAVRIEGQDMVYPTDEVIKYNSVFDLAVIRIQKTLTPLSVYQGKQKLVRGQKVVAIGSPLGLFNSVSDGIISGFRTIDNVDMIQFTAPISQGSSGGAVLNMAGEVIGISTAVMSKGQNLNLAVGYECIRFFAHGFL